MSVASRSHQLRCIRSKVALSAEVSSSHDRRRPDFTSLVNLSGTGCLIESEQPLAEGQVVFLRFSLPGQTEIETHGRVARVADSSFVGLAFQDLGDAESERIVRHVVQSSRRAHA